MSIIEARGDVDAQDKDGCTAMHHAAAGLCGCFCGSDYNEMTPSPAFDLFRCTPKRRCHRLEPQPTNFEQKPLRCLSYAIAGNRCDSVAALLRSRAAINFQDKDGRTPLLVAVKGGHIAALQLLMRSGGDLTAVDSFHRSAVHIATDNGRVECLKLLLAVRCSSLRLQFYVHLIADF